MYSAASKSAASHVSGAPHFRPTAQAPPPGATQHILRVGGQLRKEVGERLRAEVTPEPHSCGTWALGVRERAPSAADAQAGPTSALDRRGSRKSMRTAAPSGAGRGGEAGPGAAPPTSAAGW